MTLLSHGNISGFIFSKRVGRKGVPCVGTKPKPFNCSNKMALFWHIYFWPGFQFGSHFLTFTLFGQMWLESPRLHKPSCQKVSQNWYISAKTSASMKQHISTHYILLKVAGLVVSSKCYSHFLCSHETQSEFADINTKAENASKGTIYSTCLTPFLQIDFD